MHYGDDPTDTMANEGNAPSIAVPLIRLPKSTLCSAQHKNKTRRGKKVRNKGNKHSCKKDNSTSCSRKYDRSSDRRKRDKRDARTALKSALRREREELEDETGKCL